MKTLFLTVTGNPEANLESTRALLAQNTQFTKIALISTDKMRAEGNTALLEKSISALCDLEIEMIDLMDGIEDSDMFAVQNILQQWIDQQPQSTKFLFNITGGTKLQSIAQDRLSHQLTRSRAECFYQNRKQKIVWYQRHNDHVLYDISGQLSLEQRLSSRGYQIVESQRIQERINDLRYAQLLIDVMKQDFHTGRRFCSFLNKIAAMIDSSKSLSTVMHGIDNDTREGLTILSDLTEQQYFQFDPSTCKITIADEEALKFIKGGWLEVYAGYECFNALNLLSNNAELAINVEFQKDCTNNEMDIMFTHHGHLYSIECKTEKYLINNQQSNQQYKDKNKSTNILYKLASLHETGGLNHHQAVFSLYALPDHNVIRAKNAGIRIFQEKDLLNLSQLVYDWLKLE